MKRLYVELVEWVDSSGCSPSWQEDAAGDVPLMTCQSVGWILREDEKGMIVAPHRSCPEGLGVESTISGQVDEPQYCGEMTIPKCAIISRTPVTMFLRRPS